MPLSEEDEQTLRWGKAAQELLDTAVWKKFSEQLEEIRTQQIAVALQPGLTDYAKGAVYGISLCLNAPRDTVQARLELLDELRRKGLDENGEVVNGDTHGGKAP